MQISELAKATEKLACELVDISNGADASLRVLVGHAAIASAVRQLADVLARGAADPDDGHGSREEMKFRIGVMEREIDRLKAVNETLASGVSGYLDREDLVQRLVIAVGHHFDLGNVSDPLPRGPEFVALARKVRDYRF